MRTGICTTDFEVTGQIPPTADRLFGRIAELGFECVQFAFSSIAESEFARPDRSKSPTVFRRPPWMPPHAVPDGIRFPSKSSTVPSIWRTRTKKCAAKASNALLS